MGLDEVFLVEVGVDLGGGDVGVAEEFLDDAEVGPAFEEVGGEGVAEEVRIDFVGEAGARGAVFDDLAHAVGGEGAAANGEEDVGGGFARFDEFGALVVEISLDGVEGAQADGDEAGFVALSGDAEDFVVEVEVFEARVAEFGEAESGRVEKFEDGEVAATEGLRRIDGGEEVGEMVGGEGFGEFGGGLGRKEGFGGVVLEVVSLDKKAEEDFEVDEEDALGRGGKAVFSALGQEAGEVVGGEVIEGEFFLIKPEGEGVEGLLYGDLVGGREPALGGDEEEKAVDKVTHAGVF